MAKLRRIVRRPVAAKKARASAPATKSKARPAVKKTGAKPQRPAAPRKAAAARPPARRAAKPPAKPAPRRPAKSAPKSKVPAAARPALKARSKPAASPPPRRSTYADAVVLYERGLHALQAKRYRDAAEILKRVIAEFPEEKELHERAQLYIRVCVRQLTPPDATPKTPEEQVYAATLALNAGAIDRAVALLTTALQQHKDNDPAEYMLGIALTMKGDQPGALVHFARAVELNPDSRELLRKEPELEALRQTDELKALLAAPAATGRKDRKPAGRGRR